MSGTVAASSALSTQGLSVSDVVNVSISLTPTARPLQNFGAFMIIGPTPDVIDTNERYRLYTTLAGVVNDFGTSVPEYLAAKLFFGQSPQPALLYIGRWAQAATAASIHGGMLLATNQLVPTWNAITTGSMRITIDGSVKTLSNLNFGVVANLNAVAGIIDTALGDGINCVYNAAYKRFEVYSGTTGVNSTMTYATATGSGVDISTITGLSQAGGASAPCSPGLVGETPLAALSIIAQYSVWYGGMFAPTNAGDISDADYVACAGLIESYVPRRVFAYNSMEAVSLDPTNSTDLGSQLKTLGTGSSLVQYSSNSLYAVASAFARGFTVNFQGNNTTITLKFKNEPLVAAELLNETQAAALKSKNVNVFVDYANGAAIIQEGVMSDGTFFDTRTGVDWLQNQVQTDIFNLLYTSPTKTPQTDPGMHQIATVIEASLQIGVRNGLIAPGQWNAPGFGQIVPGQWLPKGYYVYCPPIASQDQSDRALRKAVPMQVAIKLGGAVHSADVNIIVNP